MKSSAMSRRMGSWRASSVAGKLVMKAHLSVQSHACRSRYGKCPSFDICAYQRQRRESPALWIVAHQLLFHELPDFILQPAALAIDETFWNAALRGLQPTVKVWLRSLRETRYVPRDLAATADLNHISQRVHAV